MSLRQRLTRLEQQASRVTSAQAWVKNVTPKRDPLLGVSVLVTTTANPRESRCGPNARLLWSIEDEGESCSLPLGDGLPIGLDRIDSGIAKIKCRIRWKLFQRIHY
jgi:hypothetical protein